MLQIESDFKLLTEHSTFFYMAETAAKIEIIKNGKNANFNIWSRWWSWVFQYECKCDFAVQEREQNFKFTSQAPLETLHDN